MFSDETMVNRIGSFGKQYFYSNKEHKRCNKASLKNVCKASYELRCRLRIICEPGRGGSGGF